MWHCSRAHSCRFLSHGCDLRPCTQALQCSHVKKPADKKNRLNKAVLLMHNFAMFRVMVLSHITILVEQLFSPLCDYVPPRASVSNYGVLPASGSMLRSLYPKPRLRLCTGVIPCTHYCPRVIYTPLRVCTKTLFLQALLGCRSPGDRPSPSRLCRIVSE